MGFERWWQLLFQMNCFSQILQSRTGQVMFCSSLEHRPKLVLCGEKRSEQGNEGWGWGASGKAKVAAVFFQLPVFSEVLRLSKSIKPLLRTLQPSDNHRSDLRLLTKKMENSRGCFMWVKIETSKNVTECSSLTEQSPWQVFQDAVICARTPMRGAPWWTFRIVMPKLHRSHARCLCWWVLRVSF